MTSICPTPIELKASISIAEVSKRLLAQLTSARHGADFSVDSYLEARLKDVMPSPLIVHGMAKAVAMIRSAIEVRNKIMICSDYDADGVCSASILTLTLRSLGVEASSIIIPDRFRDGHGLSEGVVSRIIEDKPDLLVVLDVGTTATAAVQRLSLSGVKVIAADHHHAPDGMPTWPVDCVLLNPGIAGGTVDGTSHGDQVSLGDLCAAGLTFLLSAGIRREMNRPDLDLSVQLGLAALGTVADMVPLINLNRAIVKGGLPHLPKVPGIRSIAAQSKLSLEVPTARNCGFVFGPCLNAAGRISHAGLALDLLLADDPATADEIAERVVAMNNERRAFQQGVVASCLERLRDNIPDFGVVMQDDEWHPGVIGLAASKLLEVTKRPSIVIGSGGVGSARSPSNFHIGDFIAQARSAGLLLTGGGHAAAGGFRLVSLGSHFSEFKVMYEAATMGILKPEDEADFVIDPSSVDRNFDLTALFSCLLQMLEPIGIGNDAPIVELRSVELRPGRLFGAEKQHASMFAQIGRRPIEISAFNFAGLGMYKEDFTQTRTAECLSGTLEAGFPNPKVSPGRITLRKIMWAPSQNGLTGGLSKKMELAESA